jgi:hypothetical protein
MLTKEQILATSDLVFETVDVPEWGGTVRIKELSGAERDSFEQSTFSKKGNGYEVVLKDMRARLCAMSIVDDKGERLFTDVDIKSLSSKSAKALDRVFTVCQKLNGMSKDDVDEMIKNSSAAQNESLPSD